MAPVGVVGHVDGAGVQNDGLLASRANVVVAEVVVIVVMVVVASASQPYEIQSKEN